MRLALLLLIALSCQMPAILSPTIDPQGCNENTEHDCAGGGCCLDGWTCGGPQTSLFTTCEPGYCCEESDPTNLGAKRKQKVRMPR